MAKAKSAPPPRPTLTDTELLALARMIRAYAGVEKFDNPLVAALAREVALNAAETIEKWFAAAHQPHKPRR